MNDFDPDFVLRIETMLRDGTRAAIRVMRPDDRERVIAAFDKLDEMTMYTRFFALHKHVPEHELARLDEIDFVHVAGLVVTIGSGSDERIIGGTTYIAGTAVDGTRFAEVAFTIEEDYQGQGLATRLFGILAAIARRHGIRRFVADVLASNAPMLAVFDRAGLPIRRQREGEVVHVEMDLKPDRP
jgi:RimJ/RimL family protein N-acetyltransferase